VPSLPTPFKPGVFQGHSPWKPLEKVGLARPSKVSISFLTSRVTASRNPARLARALGVVT